MTYEQTLEYLFSQLPMYQRIGKAAYKANLDTTEAFDEILGAPHKSFKCIHIAGTNGKGSTSHMLASVFQEAGFKTGLYTSPHLIDFRERVKINGVLIPEQFVVRFVEKYKAVTEKLSPSFFEWSLALAFDYFRAEKVDIAIVETGMGGRLDSTNIIRPILSIITNIGFDHQQFLGNTLEKIAREKAGIIKEEIPVVIGRNQEEIKSVFTETAAVKKAPIYFSEEPSPQVRSEFKASYQRENEACVLKAVEVLNQLGFSLDAATVHSGLQHVRKNTGLRGRWEKVQENPLVICDVGHNEDGVKEIIRQLKQEQFDHLHIVWGMVNDKDLQEILKLLPKQASYYFCRAAIPRSMPVAELLEQALMHGLEGETYNDVSSAFLAALSKASAKDLVFVGGSTFVVADLLKLLK